MKLSIYACLYLAFIPSLFTTAAKHDLYIENNLESILKRKRRSAVDEGCADQKQDCGDWAKTGYCKQKLAYRSWMAEYCPFSCNLCTPRIDESCENKRDFCDLVERYCHKSYFRSFMEKNCPRTCKVCQNPTKPININKTSKQSESKERTNKICFPTKCGLTLAQHNDDKSRLRKALKNIKLYVGRYHGPFEKNDAKQIFTSEHIERTVVHPYYRKLPYLANDIALIKLKDNYPIHFNDFVQPVCLPTRNDLSHGELLTTYGWGKTKGYGPSAKLLKEIDLPFVSYSNCRSSVWSLPERGAMCAGGARYKDTCSGDSGGSIVKRNSRDRFMFYGITSFGSYDCNSRSARTPGVFTDIAYFYNWIKKQTNACCSVATKA